jgi:NCS2 family nucleobase:cation symporter-2
MGKRPAGILYWVDEKPPWGVTLVMALQHCLLMSSSLMLPVVIVREIGGTMTQAAAAVGMSMIAVGIGTLLQTISKGPIGSGYLCPNLCGPSYLAVSVQAAWLGGLPLMHGMIMVAGVFEALLSRIIGRLRFLFPNTVTGIVVLMVGIALIPLGTSKFLGIEIAGDPVDPMNAGIASLSLLLLIGLNLWTKGHLPLYNVLLGMVVAYLLSSWAGILDQSDWQQVGQAPWMALPGQGIELFNFAFDWSLVVPFLIVALCASLKSVGNLITCQNINDAEWREADMKNVGRGLFADSIAVFSGGFLGGVAVDTSSSNVGLSAASGVTSRWIGIVAGAIFIALAFCPKLTTLLGIMPPAAMGAILLYVTSFMIAAGLKILLSTPITPRKTFVVGIALIFGLSVDILPQMYTQLHPWIKPLFSSSLTLSTVLAILLHQLFRIGGKDED